ncbi:MAG: carbohydrate deacetylase [Actinomycetota bacterium]
MSRVLVVNADDLGHSVEVNRGVARAFDHGIVTSASLMVRRPSAEDAAALARGRPELSVGLHIDLGEWIYREGEWWPVGEVVSPSNRAVVEREVEAQAGRFRDLLGRDPTHLDSHQHVHREEPARSAVLALGVRLGVPVRHFANGITYRGEFYGRSGRGEPVEGVISSDALIRIIRTLPDGVTEVACHPGAEGVLDPVYAAERARELEVLCDPEVRRAVEDEGVELRSFGQI